MDKKTITDIPLKNKIAARFRNINTFFLIIIILFLAVITAFIINNIAEDDDGGENLDSRIGRRLDSGLYYLKARCLDDEPDQPYTISIIGE